MVDLTNNEIFRANSTTLVTDFNVTPYYDDYDITKQFYRILFKPGYAVQARELTQMQSLLQKQIDLFGRNIFKEGSIVIPGQFIIDVKSPYVKVKDLDSLGNEVNISNYNNLEVTGTISGVVGTIVDVVDGVESSANTKTIYMGYTSASPSTSNTVFDVGETLVTSDGTTLIVVDSGATGNGSRFTIREGVMFAKEHFIYFPAQSIVLSRYSTSPSCKVGFYITEEIISSMTDTSLLDPAQEASNYSAPGADRFKLSPELQVIGADDDVPQNFVELFRIDNGIVTERFDRTQYNVLLDELAKRTYDESGDYYVKGLSVRVRENLDTGTNGGFDANGSSAYLSVGVEPGTAYVKGYEVNKLVTEYKTISKANTYSNASGQVATVSYGNYISCNEVIGTAASDIGVQVTLYNTANKRLTNKNWLTGGTVGANIGTARIHTIEYNSGTLGLPDGQVNLYLFDVRMNGTNSFSNVRHVANSSAAFGADIVTDTISGTAVLKDAESTTLIYTVGSDSVRTLRGDSGNPQMDFTFKRTSTVTIDQSGVFAVSFTSDASEKFPYGTTTLSDGDKREIILTVGVDSSIGLNGTVTGSLGSNVITGSVSTNFTTQLKVGDKVEIATVSGTYYVKQIIDVHTLWLDSNMAGSFSTKTMSKVYKAGDIIDLTTKGADFGETRTVSTTPTQLSIDLKETFTGDIAGSEITYRVSRSAVASPYAREISKTFRQNRLVMISVAGQTNKSGPFNLGFADVYRINKIVKKTGSAPTSLTDGTDVTNLFVLNNGQTDSYYDHGSITPRVTLGLTDYLLVSLDYFAPSFTSGRGYFSVDSYPIDDTSTVLPDGYIRTENIPWFISPTTGNAFNLRNSVDFRPVKASTATDTLLVASVSTNPARSGAFTYETNGMRLPVPASQFSYDYSHYLARQDIVVIDKDGYLRVVTGNPASTPIVPEIPENTMALAQIYVRSYPSLSPYYANSIGREDLGIAVKKLSNVRFTMRDIGALRDRISNIEYYTSLNLLEKSATDLQVLDDNGLSRFKNGYFVDTFSDHSLGDIRNPNYKIAVDGQEKSIRPSYDIKSIAYDVLSNTKLTISNGLVHLPYTEVSLISQPYATSARNVEVTSYRFNGEMFLVPETDYWVDTDVLPDNYISTGPTQSDLPATMTTWNEWQTQVVGQSTSSQSKIIYTLGWGWGILPLFGIDVSPTGPYGYRDTPSLFFHDRWQMTTTTTTTTSRTARSGVQTTYALESNTVSLGDRVVGIDYPAYMRPQIIKVMVRGLLPNGRVYPFFDGESVSSYCTPITATQHADWKDGVINPSLWVNKSSEGSSLTVNSDGTLYLLFRIPQNRFTVGTKEFRVIDSITNSDTDAVIFAKGFFSCSGIILKKQNTILTTRTIVSTSKAVSESYTSTSSSTTTSYRDLISCSAYSFLPLCPAGDEGVFLTSVDVYFQAKHPTLGIWFEIREMDSAGGITRNTVPLSVVWKKSSEVLTSGDGSVATNVKFDAPIFLYNNTQYAFVIHTEGINPGYYIWTARKGEYLFGSTTQQYTNRPLTGTFYTTNNNLNWIPVEGLDLKINFNRARFASGTSNTGTAILGNKPFQRVSLANVTSVINGNTVTTISSVGESFTGNFVMTMSGNTANISVGDRLRGITSGANSAVIKVTPISGSTAYVKVANNFFQTGEVCRVYTSLNALKGSNTSTITAVRVPTGKLSRYKKIVVGDFRNTSYEDRAEFVASDAANATFDVGDTIVGAITGATANIASVIDYRYAVVDFEPSYLNFNRTAVTYEMRTVANNGTVLDYVPVKENINYNFDNEMKVMSRSNEITSLSSGQRSNQVRVTMSTSSEYMSPILDLQRSQTLFIDNMINANTLGESYSSATLTINDANNQYLNVGNFIAGQTTGANSTIISISGNTCVINVENAEFAKDEGVIFANGASVYTGTINDIFASHNPYDGNLLNKYISKQAILDDQQDAEDLNIILTAYRPPTTDVKVWVKIAHADDQDSFQSTRWFEMEKVSNDLYSSISNTDDFREFKFQFPEWMMTGTIGDQTDVVQYTNSQGIKFSGFKYYQIKIGLLGQTAAIVPRVADLRSIALQK